MSQPDILWAMIAIASTVGNAVLIIMRIKSQGKMSISPSPLEVKASIEFATKAELQETNRRLEKCEWKIGKEINGVYESINKLREEQSNSTAKIMRDLGRIEGTVKL